MFAGNHRQTGRETQMARWMAADGDQVLSELQDVALLRSLNMHDLDYDCGWAFHGRQTLSGCNPGGSPESFINIGIIVHREEILSRN
jgi:hypothetical protein